MKSNSDFSFRKVMGLIVVSLLVGDSKGVQIESSAMAFMQ